MSGVKLQPLQRPLASGSVLAVLGWLRQSRNRFRFRLFHFSLFYRITNRDEHPFQIFPGDFVAQFFHHRLPGFCVAVAPVSNPTDCHFVLGLVTVDFSGSTKSRYAWKPSRVIEVSQRLSKEAFPLSNILSNNA